MPSKTTKKPKIPKKANAPTHSKTGKALPAAEGTKPSKNEPKPGKQVARSKLSKSVVPDADEIEIIRSELEELREQNRELADTLDAIRHGEVDAILVPDGEHGKIYTLEGPDHPYRALVENIREGALTLARDGTILYANSRFFEMVKRPADKVPGSSLLDHVCPEYRDGVAKAIEKITSQPCRSRVRLYRWKGSIPVFLTMNPLSNEAETKISVVVTDRRKDEEQIQFQALMLDSVADAVIAADPSGKIIYWNDAASKTYGWEPEEVIGKDLVSVTIPEIAAEESRKILNLLMQGKSWKGEYIVQHRDGHSFPIYASDSPIFDEDGNLIAILGASHDISDRKAAEMDLQQKNEELATKTEELRVNNEELTAVSEELRQTNDMLTANEVFLRESREQFKVLIQNVHSGVALIDERGSFTIINNAFLHIFGIPEDADILNVNSRDWSQWKVFNEHGRLLDVDEHPVRQAALAGMSVKDRLIGMKSPPSPVMKWLLVSAEPVGGSKGASPRIICTYYDITDLKAAEEALRESRDMLEDRVQQRTEELDSALKTLRNERQRLFDVLETMPAMICLLTPDYHVVFGNKAFRDQFGESQGRHCYEYCFGKTEPCDFCESFEPLKTGKPHHWEVHAPEGRIISAHDFPFTDTDGSPLILEMDLDITEQRHTEEELLKARDELEERVKARTAELSDINVRLVSEAAERKRAESELSLKNEELHTLNEDLSASHEELRQTVEELQNREHDLSAALTEKEVLLSEIHHRVKNNLTAFISLLSLEGSTEDSPAGKALMQDLQNRARSMALIHETLYRTNKFDTVDMDVYLNTLVEQVTHSLRTRRPVKVEVNAHDVVLDLPRATPIGLIVNELVTNSFKYAFPESFDTLKVRGANPTITLNFAKTDGTYTLSFSDNGIGLPAGIDLSSIKTLGLKLVNFLAQHQLRAQVTTRTENGAHFEFTFPEHG